MNHDEAIEQIHRIKVEYLSHNAKFQLGDIVCHNNWPHQLSRVVGIGVQIDDRLNGTRFGDIYCRIQRINRNGEDIGGQETWAQNVLTKCALEEAVPSEKRIIAGWIQHGNNEEENDLIFINPGDREDKSLADDSNYFLSSQIQNLTNQLGTIVTVCYFTSPTKKTWEECQKDWIQTVFGHADACYGTRYSEYTGYLGTDDECKIGGHNLIAEMQNSIGRYLLLEIEFN